MSALYNYMPNYLDLVLTAAALVLLGVAVDAPVGLLGAVLAGDGLVVVTWAGALDFAGVFDIRKYL